MSIDPKTNTRYQKCSIQTYYVVIYACVERPNHPKFSTMNLTRYREGALPKKRTKADPPLQKPS